MPLCCWMRTEETRSQDGFTPARLTYLCSSEKHPALQTLNNLVISGMIGIILSVIQSKTFEAALK